MFDKLRKSIVDAVQEGQLKLGYRSETIRLYYPLASLCLLTEKEMSAEDMTAALEKFAGENERELGRIEVSRKGERFCLAVPPQGAPRRSTTKSVPSAEVTRISDASFSIWMPNCTFGPCSAFGSVRSRLSGCSLVITNRRVLPLSSISGHSGAWMMPSTVQSTITSTSVSASITARFCWIAHEVPREVLDRIFAEVPAAFRVIWVLSRRGFARREAKAFRYA